MFAATLAVAALSTLAFEPETLGGFAARRLDHSVAVALVIAIAIAAAVACACPRSRHAGATWGLLVGCLVTNSAAALLLAGAPLAAAAYACTAYLVVQVASAVPK